MLRESSNAAENEIDLHDITEGYRHDTDIEHAELLMGFAEAVAQRDENGTAAHRQKMLELMGEPATVDAAAIAAAFHGFVRLADAIGIPYEGAAGGTDSTEMRDEIGISDFYRARNA